MLEELIEKFIYNFKKYVGCLIGFVIAILLLEYGFFKTVFVVVVSYIGFKLGDEKISKILKKKIIERLKD
ncbi:MAG: DUF2273 domain-containing protein [Cetobacterium sp.]|uniref:Small integral membrane protein n=1 Tax=Cetobacterium ceti TaxID=180163 RepID=A0A1T4L1D6_9FUSO|nr:DUF2273 domain-containing protein [Cetobacterium ceti]MCJ8341810.1 DUF2273 domain-containing protein [Cetobacterium sp.]SJZ48519.1 Small integral membrane protein [Cetobacterium ceti]